MQLLNRANAVLAQATTDAQGLVRFDPGLTRGTGAAEPAMVVATLGDDMGFLSLLDPAFDLSDRGVEGRPAPGPIDVFLATDRGVYRAGETVHLTALMRDDGARAVPGVPLTAILIRPDGVEYARVASAQDVAGGHVFALPVAPSVPRGTWTIEVRADTDAPALASTRILVEDFLPERIDVALGVPPDVAAGAPVPVDLRATYLFGPPAGDLAIEGEVVVSGFDVVIWEWPFMEFFFQAGGELWTEDGLTTTIDSPPAVEALMFLAGLVRDGAGVAGELVLQLLPESRHRFDPLRLHRGKIVLLRAVGGQVELALGHLPRVDVMRIGRFDGGGGHGGLPDIQTG